MGSVVGGLCFQNCDAEYRKVGGQNGAKAYAKCVEITSGDYDLILSDNYFDMEAGTAVVEIIEGQPKTLELRSVYDIG